MLFNNILNGVIEVYTYYLLCSSMTNLIILSHRYVPLICKFNKYVIFFLDCWLSAIKYKQTKILKENKKKTNDKYLLHNILNCIKCIK